MPHVNKITTDLVWTTILDLGKGWTNQAVANRLRVTRQAVAKHVKNGDLKARWEQLQDLSAKADPAVEELLGRVAHRMKVENLEGSVLALETYNETLVKLCNHVMGQIDNVQLQKPEDLVNLVTAIAVAQKANAETRQGLAEVMAVAGQFTGEGTESGKKAPEKASGSVVSLADRVNQRRNKDA